MKKRAAPRGVRTPTRSFARFFLFPLRKALYARTKHAARGRGCCAHALGPGDLFGCPVARKKPFEPWATASHSQNIHNPQLGLDGAELVATGRLADVGLILELKCVGTLCDSLSSHKRVSPISSCEIGAHRLLTTKPIRSKGGATAKETHENPICFFGSGSVVCVWLSSFYPFPPFFNLSPPLFLGL